MSGLDGVTHHCTKTPFPFPTSAPQESEVRNVTVGQKAVEHTTDHCCQSPALSLGSIRRVRVPVKFALPCHHACIGVKPRHLSK